LARELRGMRLLLLATYRPLEVESRPDLVESLGRATRHIQLRGLGREEVGEVIHRMTGVRPASGMVDDIHRITEGNPFFLGELVRMLDAEAMLGRPDLASLPIRIPAELRATVRQRLAAPNATHGRPPGVDRAVWGGWGRWGAIGWWSRWGPRCRPVFSTSVSRHSVRAGSRTHSSARPCTRIWHPISAASCIGASAGRWST